MIRGWCPTVHAPMPSGDGLLVRVKPFGGRLSATGLRAMAAAVGTYGNGVVEVTGRGNLQVRGVRDATAFARAMVAAGLADADPAREARRNVVAVPPCDDALVAEAEALLATMAGLPPKFCLVVAGRTVFVDGRAASLGDVSRLHAEPSSTEVVPTGSRPSGDRCLVGQGRFILPPGMGENQAASIGYLLHPPFGQTDAAALAALAGRVAEVRTTPWRAFLSAVPVPGWSATPSTVTACVGAPGCAGASVPARADAAYLAASGLRHLHVSGCAKGCAHPRPATTLVGREGRYDLVRHGLAGDPPQLRGLTPDQVMAAL